MAHWLFCSHLTGVQWALGRVLPLLLVLSEEQASQGTLHAPGPGAAGGCRVAPRALHRHLRHWPTIQRLYPALTPPAKSRTDSTSDPQLALMWTWPDPNPGALQTEALWDWTMWSSDWTGKHMVHWTLYCHVTGMQHTAELDASEETDISLRCLINTVSDSKAQGGKKQLAS